MVDQELMDIIINCPKLKMAQQLHVPNLPVNTESALLELDQGFIIFLKEVLTLK